MAEYNRILLYAFVADVRVASSQPGAPAAAQPRMLVVAARDPDDAMAQAKAAMQQSRLHARLQPLNRVDFGEVRYLDRLRNEHLKLSFAYEQQELIAQKMASVGAIKT